MGFWIYRKIRKLLQTKPVQLWGISLLAGLLVWLAAHWILGIPLLWPGSWTWYSADLWPDFPSSLSGSRSSSGRSLLPLSPGAAAPCRGWHGLDESLGLSVVSHSRSRIDPGTSETLYLSVRSIHSHDPAGREGHRRNPDFCPGNPGISRENVFGRPSDLRQLVSASPCAFGAGPNSVSAGSMLRPVDPGHLTGAALTPLLAGLAQAGFYDEVQHCLADPAYSARYAPPAPPAYIPPAAGQQPQGSAGVNVQYCPICGQAAPKSARFCNNCGTKLDGSTL